MNIRKRAYMARKILGKEPSVQEIIAFCETLDYRVIPYGDHSTEALIGERLLNELDISEYAKKQNAFPFEIDDEKKFLFIRNGMGEMETKVLLYHEIGHILAGHVIRGRVLTSSIIQENEANEFVTLLTDSKTMHSFRFYLETHKFVSSIILACFLGAVIVSGVLLWHSGYSSASNSEDDRTLNVVAAPDDGEVGEDIADPVVITLDGNEYHQMDCSALAGKTKLIVPREEAIKLHKPCPICHP